MAVGVVLFVVFFGAPLAAGASMRAALVDTDVRLAILRDLAPVAGRRPVASGGRPVFHLPGGAAHDGLGANPSALQATVDRRARDGRGARGRDHLAAGKSTRSSRS